MHWNVRTAAPLHSFEQVLGKRRWAEARVDDSGLFGWMERVWAVTLKVKEFTGMHNHDSQPGTGYRQVKRLSTNGQPKLHQAIVPGQREVNRNFGTRGVRSTAAPWALVRQE